MRESSNTRPGEPLRSWTDQTEVLQADAIFTVRMAKAHDALQSLMTGQSLNAEQLIALGRLNSYAVARWYEPVVSLMSTAHIDPGVAEVFMPLLSKEADT